MNQFLLQHAALFGASSWPFGLLVALPAVLMTLWLSWRFGVTPGARMVNYCGGLIGLLVVGALWSRFIPWEMSEELRHGPYYPLVVSALAAFSSAIGVVGITFVRRSCIHAWRVVWARWRNPSRWHD